MSCFLRKLIYLCALALWFVSQPTWSKTVAARITPDNAIEYVQQGPDAIGGIGDWFISNGTLCAVITDIPHEGEFSSRGGVLTDLGFCSRADDHMTSIQDLLDGKRSSPMDVTTIKLEQSDHKATIITLAEQSGVQVTTRYTLDIRKPTELSIDKELRVNKDATVEFNFYSAAWFNYFSLETYILASTERLDARGFNNVDFVTRGVSAITEAVSAADTVVLMSPPEAEHPIAYGWHLKSANRVTANTSYPVPRFILSDEESTVMLFLADRFYLGDGAKLGWLQLAQVPFLTLDEDDYIEINEVIYVGERTDVASIVDQIIPAEKTVIGKSNEPSSALHVFDTVQNPVNFVRPDKEGNFVFTLRPGSYLVQHIGTGNRMVEHSLTVEQSSAAPGLLLSDEVINMGELILPAAGQLILPRGEAMRLVIVGSNGTPDPNFQDRLTKYSVRTGDQKFQTPAIRQLFLAGIESDPNVVDMAPGTYRVYATRGLEYSLSYSDVTIEQGVATRLTIDIPERVVESPGYIGADLHVHAGVGFDNSFSTTLRVKTFVAEHGEVIVASEHDVLFDYQPIIDQMRLNDKLVSIAAVEMTSLLATERNPYSGGHVNFFPVQPDPFAYRKGMIKHEDRRLREVLSEFSHKHPDSISQLNHARENSDLSGELPNNYEEKIYSGAFLEHMGSAGYPYNPAQSLLTQPNNHLLAPDPDSGVRDIDFDAMEIINPGGPFHQDRIDALRKDWLSFIRQGFHITGTANSDSHHAGQQVAVPRTMVAMHDDRVESFDQDEFIAAIRKGNVYGTTGPMLEVSLAGAAGVSTMGDTYRGQTGKLNVSIRSPDWIPIDTIKVQVNAATVIDLKLNGQADHAFDLTFNKDSFITVELNGTASQEYQLLYPEITPYAFTNPIYVDYDADGEWVPPGL